MLFAGLGPKLVRLFLNAEGQRALGSQHWVSFEVLPPQTSLGLCDGSGLLMRAKFWFGFSPVWEILPQDRLFQCLCCPSVLPSCRQGAAISGNVNLGRVLFSCIFENCQARISKMHHKPSIWGLMILLIPSEFLSESLPATIWCHL